MESSRCRAFVRAVSLGSLTAAAKSLGYTTSGVSQLITALEDDLGIPLLIRNRKGVQPTEEGKLIYQAANAYLAREDEIYQLAAEIKGVSTGTITIASYASISINILPELLKSFLNVYPGISIRIVEGSKAQIDEWLKSGFADIAFTSKFSSRAYSWVEFMEDELYVLLPPDHRLADRKTIHAEELRDENFVMTVRGDDLDVIDVFNKYSISPNIKFTTYENDSAVSLVNSGLGITILNNLAITNQRNCIKIPLEPAEYIQYGMATPAHINQTPAVKKLMDYATKYLR